MADPPIVTIKHLCREFDLDPYPLRQYLREHMTTHQKHQRWQWPAQSKDLRRAKELAKQLKEKSS